MKKYKIIYQENQNTKEIILETKSLRNTNLTNQYLYIQAKNQA